MKTWITTIMVFTASLASAAQVNSLRCSDEKYFLDTAWEVIAKAEPMLPSSFKMTTNASGTTNLFNCRVSFPIDDRNKAIVGVRTVILDQQWYREGVFQHHGYRIEYNLQSASYSATKGHSIDRKIISFETCRTPAACRKLQIPAGQDAKMLSESEEFNGRSNERNEGSYPPPTGGSGGWQPVDPGGQTIKGIFEIPTS